MCAADRVCIRTRGPSRGRHLESGRAAAFDNDDPIGLVAGKRIPADCSINWTDPDTHKLYCFASATSLVYFLDAPQTYLTEAEKSWRTLQGKPADSR